MKIISHQLSAISYQPPVTSYQQSQPPATAGQAVIASVIFLVLLSVVIIAGFATPLTRELKNVRLAANSLQSYFTAESGVEDAAYRIKANLSYLPEYDLDLNGARATVSIVSAGNTRTINVTGNNQNHLRLVEARLTISSVNPQFFYGAQVGEGGLEMGNGSQIKGAAGAVGNLYSNGPVVGFGSGLESIVTGDVLVATGVAIGDQSTTCNTDQIAGQTNPQIDFAQSFRATDSKPLSKVSLYLKKVGTPTNRTVKITADNNGAPASAALASDKLTASLVTTNYGWIDVVFESPATLIANTTYWLILDVAQDNNDYWVWCRDTNNGYGNGQSKYKQDWSTGGSWTANTGDLTFKTYLGTGVSTLDKMVVYGDVKTNTITNSKICGDAYYQSIDSSSLNFLNAPADPPCLSPVTNGVAYPNSGDPPVSPLPISQANIDEWKAAAAAGGSCVQPQCDISGNLNVDADLSFGPKKILGNLNFTANGKTLAITGTTYVVGNVDISNNATIRCDSGYNNDSCVVVTDGQIVVGNGAQFQGSGQAGSYILLLTTKAGGADDSAIELNNNALGAIMYAANGAVELENNVNATEVIGYKLELENGATITYEQGLLNSSFTTGPGISFVIDGWKEVQ